MPPPPHARADSTEPRVEQAKLSVAAQRNYAVWLRSRILAISVRSPGDSDGATVHKCAKASRSKLVGLRFRSRSPASNELVAANNSTSKAA
jgi:hypothetical protein